MTTPVQLPENYQAAFFEMSTRLAGQELMIEDLTQTVLAIDNIGWAPLNGDYNGERGVPLEALKRWAEFNEQLLAINPLVKRGSNIRVSYIFGEDIEYQKDTNTCRKFREANEEFLFSHQALTELEHTLGTAGNAFFLLAKEDKSVVRIPLREITNVAVKPGLSEVKWYIQRTWVEAINASDDPEQQKSKTRTIKMWYPLVDYKGPTYTSIGGVPVDNSKAMLHISVNRQVGWLYGVPDIQPAVFWAKAYKEFLEANFTLVKALSRFAFKVSNKTAAGVKRSAAQIAAPVPSDIYGRQQAVGSTISMTDGSDLTAVNKAGANVSFEAGKPLAAMVASALEVNVEHLLSTADAPGGSETLDTPQLKAMTARQKIIARAMRQIFTYFGFKAVIPVFPPIQWEPVHRVLQAITTAASTNALHPEETRDLIVTAMRQLGIDPLDGIPEDGRNAEFVSGINAAEQAQQQADLAKQGLDNQASAAKDKAKGVNKNPGTSPQKTPKGSSKAGKRSPAGATADGDHEQRKSQ
jgi:hypothetical protein